VRVPGSETPTVLLAMPDTTERGTLARSLIDSGDRVFICSAPWTGDGSCPLIREAPCALVEFADVAVVSEDPPRSRAEGAPGLCALYARRSIAIKREPIEEIIGSIKRITSGGGVAR
jgi:hypothetical protein